RSGPGDRRVGLGGGRGARRRVGRGVGRVDRELRRPEDRRAERRGPGPKRDVVGGVRALVGRTGGVLHVVEAPLTRRRVRVVDQPVGRVRLERRRDGDRVPGVTGQRAGGALGDQGGRRAAAVGVDRNLVL